MIWGTPFFETTMNDVNGVKTTDSYSHQVAVPFKCLSVCYYQYQVSVLWLLTSKVSLSFNDQYLQVMRLQALKMIKGSTLHKRPGKPVACLRQSHQRKFWSLVVDDILNKCSMIVKRELHIWIHLFNQSWSLTIKYVSGGTSITRDHPNDSNMLILVYMKSVHVCWMITSWRTSLSRVLGSVIFWRPELQLRCS